MHSAINLRAQRTRATWTPERRERERTNGKAHYARRMLRSSSGLCAYSVNCDEPPVGTQNFCLWHWCNGLRQADLRQKSQYKTDDLVVQWNQQKGRCAITGILLVAGETAALDHLVPVARGGSSIISNLRFIHASINRFNWGSTDDEFKS